MSERYTVRVAGSKLTFAAAHFITFDDGECEPLHGHDFRIVVELAGPLGPRQYVVDFTEVEAMMAELIAPLDHRVLLAEDHPEMEIVEQDAHYAIRLGRQRWLLPREGCTLVPVENTTAESMAEWLAQELIEQIEERTGIQPDWLAVEYHEGPGYSARFSLGTPPS